MHRGALLAALLTASLLAGCTAETPETLHGDGMCPDGSMVLPGDRCPTPTPSSDPPTLDRSTPERMTIRGVVLDGALQPIPTAAVRLVELNQTQAVGPGGTFQFESLVPSTYFLTASAPEFTAQTLSIESAKAQETLRFVLEALPTDVAFNETFHFHGRLQCALEAVIISPACDTVITTEPVNHEPVLNDTFSAILPVDPNWKTVVTDVVFDPEAQPGLDGLRVTVRGTYDAHQLGTYAAYGQFNASTPFTFRVEPGQSYEGGEKEVPSNTTQFQLDTYPHSHGWHTVCVPGYDCFLGAGAGLDVDFDLYMTVFYVAPAPEGWTLQV